MNILRVAIFLSLLYLKADSNCSDFKLADFSVSSDKEIYVRNMKEVENPVKGKYKRQIGKEEHDYTDVQFNITHPTCIPPSSGIQILWNFGNGLESKESLKSLTKVHRYTSRGQYDFSATFTMGNDSYIAHGTLYIGIIQNFSVSPYNVTVGNSALYSVTVHNNLKSRVQRYQFYPNSTCINSGTTASAWFRYTQPYIHIPSAYVTLTNGLQERVYSTTQLAIDYDLSVGSIKLISGYNRVSLPPGFNTLTMQVQSVTNYTAANATCNITTGDKVNRTEFSFDHNFRYSSSKSVSYKHDSLGTMTSKAYCYNSISEVRTELTFEVVNGCFLINERFDRQNSMPDSPLEVSFTEDFVLYSRSVIICKEMGTFNWTVEYADTQSQSINYTDVNFENKADPSTNVILIPKYSLRQPGLYKITSFIYVNNTWLEEYTFVRFILPPPTAFIRGGDSARAKDKKNTQIELNAVDVSYQEAIGDEVHVNRTYNWACSRSDGKAVKECKKDEGKWTLKMDKSVSYVITVTVANKHHSSSFTQKIIRVKSYVPVVSIRCLFNCGQKAVVSRRTIYTVDCQDCKARRKYYLWYLELHDSTLGDKKIEAEKLKKMTLNNETKKRIIIIKEGVLKKNTRYTLSVIQNEKWSRCRRFTWWKWCDTKPGWASHVSVSFQTGSAPISGKCNVDPLSGYAMTTAFRINCTGWKVENYDHESAQHPLLYNYRARIFQKDGEMLSNFSTTLYSGYESSVGNLTLPTGPEENLRIVEITVEIIDHLGEWSDWSRNVTVYPLDETLTSNDDEKFDSLFQTYERLNIREIRNRNYLSQLQLMLSVSSMFTNKSSVDNSRDGIAKILSESCSYTSFLDHKLIERYSEKVEEILNNISNIVNITHDTVLTHQMLNLITWTMHSLTRHPQYLNENSISLILKIFQQFSLRIKSNFEIRPFMMKYKGVMDDAIKGMVSVLRSVVFQIYARDARAKRKDIDITLLEKARNHPCEKYLEDYLQSTENITSLKDTFQGGIEEVISTLQEALLSVLVKGEGGISLDIGQTTMKVNRTQLEEVSYGVEDDIPVEEMEEEIVCEEMEYGGDKNPYKSSDNGHVVDTLVKQSRCYTNYSLPIVIKLKESKKFQRISSVINPDDPEQMIYLKLNASKKAVLIYFYPADIDKKVLQSRRNSLYTLYVRRDQRPTSRQNHFDKKITMNDWSEGLGFKIFVHKGICGEGYCFLGLKPRNVLIKKVIFQEQTTVAEQSNSTVQNVSVAEQSNSTVQNVSVAEQSNSTVQNVSVAEQSNSTEQNVSVAEQSYSTLQNVSVTLLQVELNAIITTIGCAAQINNSWEDDACKPLPMSNIEEVRCRCPDIPSSQRDVVYGSSFLAVNSIDFDAAFLNFDIGNAAVYGTIIAILVLYCLLVLFLRRKDTEDKEKWTLGILCDNSKDDDYFYLVTVVTGLRAGAGTQSIVNFILYGELGESGVRILSDDLQKGFATGSINRFIMSSPKYLGRLLDLWIWHDFSGIGWEQSWYLTSVTFDDLKTKDRYVFQCDTWLALDKVNGLTDCLASSTDVHDSKVLFSNQLFYNITENNLWFSIVFRPEQSSFTRVQRLSCILAFLFLAMLANAMFYEAPGTEKEEILKIGIISFSLTTLFTSLKSAAITTPPIIFVTLIFQHTREKTAETKKENCVELTRTSRKRLPHWMRYLACGIIASAIASSSFLLLMYSMQWGRSKSQEWLSSFMFSFLASATCFDPLKVLLFAAVFSFVMKHPATNRGVEFDEKLLKKYCTFHSSKKSKQYAELVGSVFHKMKPFSDSKFLDMRKRQQEAAAAKNSFRDLMISLILAGSVVAIGFTEFDVNAYYLQNNIRNYLVSDGYGQFGFSAVNDSDGFYKWMNDTFIPACYPLQTYNEVNLDILGKQMFGDLASIRVGPARVRQVRMPKRKCESTLISTIYPCIDTYDLTKEDKGTYCRKWNQSVNCRDSDFLSTEWTYIDSSAIWGLPISAVYNTYSGGGYFFLLEEERAQSKLQIQNAKEDNWIDRHTRAVMTEFTLYNPNTNMFINAVLVLEFLEHGIAMPDIHLRPFTRSLEFHECPTSLQASFVIFVIHLIFLCVSIVHQIITDFKNVIKRVWFWVDVLFALTSASSIVLFVIRKKISDNAEEMYYDQQYTGENNFINFYQIIVLNITIQVVIGFISFMAILRILRAFEYSNRLSAFWRVISDSASPLLGFFFVFGITLCAFASMVYLRFGKFVYSFRNMAIVFGSLANTLIGKNDVVILMKASPVFAVFFYFTYGVTVIFLLLNIFAAILNETIDMVKRKAKSAGDVFGIGDYTLASVRDVINMISTISFSKETKKDDICHNEAKQNIDVHAIVGILRRVFRTYQKQTENEPTCMNDYVISRHMDKDDGNVDNSDAEDIETDEDLEINRQSMLKYI